MSICSQAFYVLTRSDELWKELVLDHFTTDNGTATFTIQPRSWRETFIVKYVNTKTTTTAITTATSSSSNDSNLRSRPFYSDALYNRWFCSTVDPNHWASPDVNNVDRRNDLSLAEFVEQYERSFTPVIITDVVNKWPAFHEWTKERLLERYGDVIFKTDQAVRMPLRDYFCYSSSLQEKNPMYLFDNQFCEKAPAMESEYQVPLYFRQDFFELLALSGRRPSYRWLLIGPTRSGSSFHKDPNFTSAW
jgi:hypothetical protein